MRGLPPLSESDLVHARRWDAVVLGGALPGLITAVVLGMRGRRVLVLEEAEAVDDFQGLREPFFMPPARSTGILGACLGALGIPLIERRRIATDPIAYQVVLPDARVDWGEPARTIDELVAWNLAKPDTASELVRALARTAEAERSALLEAPVVRSGRRRTRPRPQAGAAAGAAPARGLPPRWDAAPPLLAAALAAQVRALSNLGTAEPSSEARARLLGGALEGGGIFREGNPWLRDLLRQRIRSLHGEFHSVRGRLRLLAAGRQVAVATSHAREICVGRALVLNVGCAALASGLERQPAPSWLRAAAPSRRRLVLHYRAPARVLPEGMAPRVVWVGNAAAPLDGTNVVTLRVFPGAPGSVDLVASAVVPTGDAASPDPKSEIEAALRRLMPFAGDALARQPAARASWDVDGDLADPARGASWPADTELRPTTRASVYALERSGVAALGCEGDVLLGWRAGDAIAADLT